MRIFLVFCILIATFQLKAQEPTSKKNDLNVDLGVGLGSSKISITSAFNYNWQLGKKKKIVIGTGIRYTWFSGNNINFTSAPSKLAADEKSVDTLLASTPNVHSLNLLINLGYNISPKLQVGFSIDVVGFSFGPTGNPTFISDGKSKVSEANPTKANILLIGDNDIGSLNSFFYAKYKLTERFGIKLGFQYLFNELTTTTNVQTLPTQNDRFRAKSALGYIGVTYNF
jgi:long-subunit fatty acid transport protein